MAYQNAAEHLTYEHKRKTTETFFFLVKKPLKKEHNSNYETKLITIETSFSQFIVRDEQTNERTNKQIYDPIVFSKYYLKNKTFN